VNVVISPECHGGGPYADIKDLSNITVTSGGSAVFKFTEQKGFKLTWCMFGVAKAGVSSPTPDFLRVEYNDTTKQTSTKNGSLVDDRVSSIGNMSIGQAWFKIDNVKPADTKTYKVRCNVVVPYNEQHTATAVLEVPNGKTNNNNNVIYPKTDQTDQTDQADIANIVYECSYRIEIKIYDDRQTDRCSTARIHFT